MTLFYQIRAALNTIYPFHLWALKFRDVFVGFSTTTSVHGLPNSVTARGEINFVLHKGF